MMLPKWLRRALSACVHGCCSPIRVAHSEGFSQSWFSDQNFTTSLKWVHMAKCCSAQEQNYAGQKAVAYKAACGLPNWRSVQTSETDQRIGQVPHPIPLAVLCCQTR